MERLRKRGKLRTSGLNTVSSRQKNRSASNRLRLNFCAASFVTRLHDFSTPSISQTFQSLSATQRTLHIPECQSCHLDWPWLCVAEGLPRNLRSENQGVRHIFQSESDIQVQSIHTAALAADCPKEWLCTLQAASTRG
jgi:hypothetical protein